MNYVGLPGEDISLSPALYQSRGIFREIPFFPYLDTNCKSVNLVFQPQ